MRQELFTISGRRTTIGNGRDFGSGIHKRVVPFRLVAQVDLSFGKVSTRLTQSNADALGIRADLIADSDGKSKIRVTLGRRIPTWAVYKLIV